MSRLLGLMTSCLLLAACTGISTPTSSPAGTALEPTNAHGWATIQKVGTRFTDGFETLDVVSEPVEVTSVRFGGGEGGLKLVGYELVPSPRKLASIQLLKGFPPKDARLPDARVPSGGQLKVDPTGQGYQLLLGIEVTAPGRWTRNSLIVGYTSSGTPYEQTFDAELTVCTPAFVDAEGECPFPDR